MGTPESRVRIRSATIADSTAVLALFDEAVAWFQTFGNTGQWGTEPFSTQQRQIDRVTSWLSQPGGWIAEVPTVPVAGVLVLGEKHDYIPPVTGEELYVRLLLGSRADEAKGVGRELLAFADQQAEYAGVGSLRVDCYGGGSGRLVEFYESCGYYRTQEFRVGEWPGQLLERRVIF